MNRFRLFGFGLFIILFLIVLGWGYDLYKGQLPTVDVWSRHVAENFINTPFYNVFRNITNLGSKSFLIPFTLVMMILLCFLYKEFITPVMLGLGTLVCWLTNHFIKLIFKRERPSILESADGIGYSFPSGHSMISFVFYGLLAYFLIKKIKMNHFRIFIAIGAAILISLIGLSRYFINVHYLTDIVAGYLLGWIFMFIWLKFYNSLMKRKCIR